MIPSVLLALAACAPDVPPDGVRLVALEARGAVAKAGLRAGDLVLSFHRGAGSDRVSGPLSSCTGWARIEVGEAPRGPVELVFRRDGARRQARLAAGEWQAEVEPAAAGHPDLELCRSLNLAIAAARRRDAERALEAYRRVALEARKRVDRDFEARALFGLGMVEVDHQRHEEAEATLGQALALRRQAESGTLHEAQVWHALGRLARLRGRLDEAEQALGRALEIRTLLAPRSLERSYTLNNLGIVAFSRSDLGTAEARYRESFELVRSLAPGSEDEAQMLANLGLVARDQGDLAKAEALCRQAYELSLRLNPEGSGLPRDLTNLSALASDRGDLARAADYLWEALERFEKVEPGGTQTAAVLFNLGANLRDRGELRRSEEMLRRALALHHQLSPGSLLEATDLSSLSWVVAELGRVDEGVELARAALAIRERLAPRSLEHANGLGTLAQALARRGEIEAALAHAEETLRLVEAAGPDTRVHAATLESLGSFALKAGELDRAERAIRQSIAVRQRLHPTHQWLANTFALLGRVQAERRQWRQAEASYLSALAAAEEQGGRVGEADETRARFNQRFSEVYHELVSVQVRSGKPEEALATLERSRGRALLAQLARRASKAVPLTSRALDLEGVRAALDPGTVWLSYSVGPDSSWLFVLPGSALGRQGELEVFELPLGRAALAREVSVFRGLILLGREQPAERQALDAQRQRLSALLLAPAAEALSTAERLLVSPDGPLHTVPFGALTPPGEARGTLVERLPVHRALSATVYAELAERRAEAPDGVWEVAVFADPRITAVATEGARRLEGVHGRYAGGLPRLPAGREEAEAVRRILGRRARVFEGEAATERQLRALPAQTRWLHVASHALLDERSPLQSALALATPRAQAHGARPAEADDGLLEAWEIFEQLRLPLELVTLSACDTGLGEEVGGEGLLGLSRAFQYAGARSVVAALWPVSDRSTSRLMEHFYRALAGGASKDQALAQAQRALLASPAAESAYSHPYHWAAFELIGDWK